MLPRYTMKRTFLALLLFILHFASYAQFTANNDIKEHAAFRNYDYNRQAAISIPAKLRQTNQGMIIGLQRGASTAIELGYEAHWRKMSWRKPRITGATTNMEYNFGNHVIGYKAGLWMKQGRVNLTYGGNLVYYNDFKGLQRFGAGPSIGFRLVGFHLINGYNFLAGDKELDKVNTLYITLRYYFPTNNKFSWDKKEKKKRAREKEKRKKKKAKDKRKNNKEEEKKGLKKIFDFSKLKRDN